MKSDVAFCLRGQELLQPLPLDGMNLPKESPVKENVVKEDNALASLGSRILGDCISETQVSQNGRKQLLVN